MRVPFLFGQLSQINTSLLLLIELILIMREQSDENSICLNNSDKKGCHF
jgi:hypothetical protein